MVLLSHQCVTWDNLHSGPFVDGSRRYVVQRRKVIHLNVGPETQHIAPSHRAEQPHSQDAVPWIEIKLHPSQKAVKMLLYNKIFIFEGKPNAPKPRIRHLEMNSLHQSPITGIFIQYISTLQGGLLNPSTLSQIFVELTCIIIII